MNSFDNDFWKNDSKVLIISAEPEEYERNDSILFCQKEAFPLSQAGLNNQIRNIWREKWHPESFIWQ